MGSVERRQRERESVRQKILDAARELFVAHGFEAVTMRKIAEKIEYTPTAIYFHFKDKDALFRELCSQDFLSLARAFERLTRVADPVERLRRIGLAYVAFAVEHPQHYRLMFMTPRPDVAPDTSNQGIPERDAYAFLRLTIQDGIQQRRFAPSVKDPDLVAQAAWGAIHGIIALHLTMKDDDWIQWRSLKKTATLIVESLVAGLTVSS